MKLRRALLIVATALAAGLISITEGLPELFGVLALTSMSALYGIARAFDEEGLN